MIEKLGYEGKRLFEAELSNDKRALSITDARDFYSSFNLTKSEVIELANDFLKLAEQMVDAEIGKRSASGEEE